MIYPSIDKLLNIVDSKYKLVHVVADRAKVMKEHKHFQMNEDEYVSKKEIGRALEEIEKGLLIVKEN
jgi:DNA-directed RNA polymerase subunit omega